MGYDMTFVFVGALYNYPSYVMVVKPLFLLNKNRKDITMRRRFVFVLVIRLFRKEVTILIGW